MSGPSRSIVENANAELFGKGNLDAVGEFFSPEYEVHVTGRGPIAGHDGIRRSLRMIRKAFPDVEVAVEVLVEGTDRIAWRRTLSGTQEGSYGGFPASGKRLVWQEMVTSRFAEGLIVEEWLVSNLAERLLLSRKK